MIRKALLIVLLLAFGSACSTTSLVESWRAEEFNRSDLSDVLIVAVTSSPTDRLLFETEFERDMQLDGVEAVTSTKALGGDFPHQDRLDAYVATHRIKYIIATTMEDVEVEREVVPAHVVTFYSGPFYPTIGHYYDGYYGNVVTLAQEGYVDTRETVHMVTTVYEVENGQPVWVGRSDSFEPSSFAEVADDIATTMWRDMVR